MYSTPHSREGDLHNNGTSHSNKDSAATRTQIASTLYHLVWPDARVGAGQVHAEAPRVGGAGVQGVAGARPARVARPGLRVELLVAVAVLPVQTPATRQTSL